MVCPRCGGRVGVTDVVNNEKENETYRRKRCASCHKEFFTVEFEVIENERFRREWIDWRRKSIGEKK